MTVNTLIAISPLFKVVRWVDAIVCLTIRAKKLVDEFFMRLPNWMNMGGRLNSYIAMRDTVGHKMHGGLRMPTDGRVGS